MTLVKLVSSSHSAHHLLVIKHQNDLNMAIMELEAAGFEVDDMYPTQMRVSTQELDFTTLICYKPKATEEKGEK